jgi:two-component system nitrogen regulation sensor histidine kinase NtrY
VVRNAVDAALETRDGVDVTWRRTDDGGTEVDVVDEGHGIASTDNLFVPFFTTKPTGSGIGLVLSRQIAEAHDGTLDLLPRSAGHGCVARLRLPPRASGVARDAPAVSEFESKGRSAGRSSES